MWIKKHSLFTDTTSYLDLILLDTTHRQLVFLLLESMTEVEELKKEKKVPPPNLVIPPKKPKLNKAERRALQEKQRAEKAGKQPDEKPDIVAYQPPEVKVEAVEPSKNISAGSVKPVLKSKPAIASEEGNEEKKMDDKTIHLFSHLPQYQGKKLFDDTEIPYCILFS